MVRTVRDPSYGLRAAPRLLPKGKTDGSKTAMEKQQERDRAANKSANLRKRGNKQLVSKKKQA